jgi:hypothetical protein
MEAANKAAGTPVYWRLNDEGKAEKGFEAGTTWANCWEAVHPLSTFLLAQSRAATEAEAQGIWF